MSASLPRLTPELFTTESPAYSRRFQSTDEPHVTHAQEIKVLVSRPSCLQVSFPLRTLRLVEWFASGLCNGHWDNRLCWGLNAGQPWLSRFFFNNGGECFVPTKLRRPKSWLSPFFRGELSPVQANKAPALLPLHNVQHLSA